MPTITSIIKSSVLSLSALLLTGITPLGLIGASSIANADDCQPDTSQPGNHQPSGADASAFSYHCDGSWTSQYYRYDPSSGERIPTYDPNYQYDCSAGSWTKAEYDWNAATSSYSLNRVRGNPPAGTPTGCPVAAPAAAAGGSGAGTASGTGTGGGSGNGITAAGPNSTTNSTTNGTNNTTLNNTTNATMTNGINGVATSGNSLVLGNTSAGGAQSGDAYNAANIVNMLQSSSNALGSDGNTIVFTRNIDGDVNGDLFLDPNQLSSVQNAGPNSSLNSSDNLTNNVTVNNATSGTINNNVNLASQSGDATVKNNTSGGSAKTGNAEAVANITNIINSSLMAGHSFIGTVNINGNLNGDILLPDNFVDQLLAANTPTVTVAAPSSNTNVNDTANSNSTVTNTNNLGITNNVNASAGTGAANLSNNTSAGNARSGNATTNITAFNLTGSNVIGKNSILVFVNAPGGKWVGVIVNAPQGTTAAALGGGITSSGPSSTTNVTKNVNGNASLTNTINGKINNNITTNANSGNANVDSNTRGGDATSGDASSAVNLNNIENSTLDLSGWLGILFINVFGSWNGSFGVNTSAGDPIAQAMGGQPALTGAGSGNAPGQVFRFAARTDPTATTSGSSTTGGSGNGNNAQVTSIPTANTVFGTQSVRSTAASAAPTPQLASSPSSLTSKVGIIGTAVFIYILADAFWTHRAALGKIRTRR